jgi:hypothetical protein
LVLDENITLMGVQQRSNPLIDQLDSVVSVLSGGTLVMNDGSTITSNISFWHGGGVSVTGGGTFLMKGGTITGNTCFQPANASAMAASGGKINALSEMPRKGGGVYVAKGGTFTKTGGTITGYASDPQNGNVTKTLNGIDVSQNNGHAVYAGEKRKEKTAGPDVNLHYSNGTFSGDWDF